MYEAAIAAHTVASAMITDSPMARYGLSVTERAAAGGPIIRLKISSAPTTGSAMLVASAMTSRKQISMRWLRTPRASPSSGITEASISGRNSTSTATMHTAPSAATGATSLTLMPSTSPNSSE